MKKNRTMRAAALLLALTLITSCFVGGTFAKYTGAIEATDTARVALFKVRAFGTDVDAQNDTATVDIFVDSKVYDTVDADYTTAGTNDANIADSTDAIIAPGSWGEFSFTVENLSEVDVTYAVDYTVDEKGVPLQWSIDNGLTWTEDLADVAAKALNMSATETTRILWKWDYTDDAARDTSDTTLGFAGSARPSVAIKVTFVQVD